MMAKQETTHPANAGEDGGAAFPVPMIPMDAAKGTYTEVRYEGMTLRDYFAAHAPRPSLEDVAVVLGWPEGLSSEKPRPFPRLGTDEPEPDSLEKRWRETSHADRMRAVIAVRWNYADAMLLARREGKA